MYPRREMVRSLSWLALRIRRSSKVRTTVLQQTADKQIRVSGLWFGMWSRRKGFPGRWG